jgi:predicted HAD superfamily phosphohydrolase YqeG
MSGLGHILAGITLGFCHRRQLSCLIRETPYDNGILSLDPVALKTSGVAALALDFDGVLAYHGAQAPLPESVEWLKRCVDVFGGDRIFILSNKPTDVRRLWFSEHFPTLRFIGGVRKKPYPDGLCMAGKLAGVPMPAVLMVDDRLLTGCLAAVSAGARPCYIRHPYVSYRHSTAAELFFTLLRQAERCFVKTITIM